MLHLLNTKTSNKTITYFCQKTNLLLITILYKIKNNSLAVQHNPYFNSIALMWYSVITQYAIMLL